MLDVALLIAGVFSFTVQFVTENTSPGTLAGDYPLQGLLTMVLVSLYAWIGFFVPPSKKTTVAKAILLLALVGTTVILATAHLMERRLQEGSHLHIHDHPLQIELALGYLLEGKNPYVMDYFGTPMETLSPSNPALHHVISLPTVFLVSAPILAIWKGLFGWFDERIVHIVMLFASMGALWTLFRRTDLKFAAIIALVFGPLFARFFVEGMNDILFLAFIFWALACLRNRQERAALIFLALAITTKHTAWFIVPFFFTYLAATGYFKKDAIEKILPFVLLTTLIIAPFAAWDWNAFIDDIYRYPAGTLPTSYPVNGYNLGMTLHQWGYLPNRFAPYPPSWFKLLLLPLLGVLMAELYRVPRISRVLLCYAALLWPFWYLSRFLHGNYMGVIVILFAVGTMLAYDELPLRASGAPKSPASKSDKNVTARKKKPKKPAVRRSR